MRAVQSAATMVGRHLDHPYTVVVNKSTVPIGSGDWVGMLIREGLRQRATASQPARPTRGGVVLAEREPTPAFDVVANPEFLREGSALSDALYPERIVIGADSERAVALMRAIYRPLLERSFPALSGTPPRNGPATPLLVTDRTSAEMIKYAANAFLATKISFINEIANLCERIGADVGQVAAGIGMDSRIGRGFLNAGIGWGGSCFPKDLASLCFTAREYGSECRLLEAVQEVNAAQRLLLIRKLQERLKVLKGKTVTLWGLAFKPGTDDVRDAPAHTIARRLLELGVRVQAYDPVAMPNAQRWGLSIELRESAVSAAAESDAIVLVTDWEEFARQNWGEVRAAMRRALIIDGRNFLSRAELLVHGFEYCGIGR
jgi:UDPglucose 6-dehydrogenase